MQSTALAITPRGVYGGTSNPAKDAYVAEVTRLRARIEELEAEVHYLKDMVSPPGLIFPTRWKLTEKEARLLRTLMAAAQITKEKLLVALYDTEPEAEIKIVDVFVCKLRNKLAVDGIKIETMWGSGYRIEPPMKAIILDAAEHAKSGNEWVPQSGPAARPLAHLTVTSYTGAELKAQRHALNLSQESVRKIASLAHAGFVSAVETGNCVPKYHRAVEDALRSERRRRCLPDPQPTGG